MVTYAASERVYRPQADTIMLVGALRRMSTLRGARVVDLCTGSGIVGTPFVGGSATATGAIAFVSTRIGATCLPSLAATTGAGKTVMAAAAIEALFWGNETFDFEPDPGAVVLWFSDDPSLNLRADYSLFDRSTGRPLCVGNGESCRRSGQDVCIRSFDPLFTGQPGCQIDGKHQHQQHCTDGPGGVEIAVLKGTEVEQHRQHDPAFGGYQPAAGQECGSPYCGGICRCR